MISAAVIESNKEVVAFGMMRLLTEAILVCEGSKKDKTLILFELICQMIKDAKRFEIPQIHVFIQDDKFADLLIKHFNFKEEQGRTLVLGID